MTSTRTSCESSCMPNGINGEQSRPPGDDARSAARLANRVAGSIVASVPATRPATDYTARIIPHRAGVAVPLEVDPILWQR